MSEITEDFRKAMADWVELKKQLTEARNDMKVLNQREKELKKFIMGYMQEEKIDKINLKKGKVTLRETKKTETLKKEHVETGLRTFFGGDEAKIEGAISCIMDGLEKKSSSVISLTGINSSKKEA
jgi:polyphosphate kinase 2 (PPK2 family)